MVVATNDGWDSRVKFRGIPWICLLVNRDPYIPYVVGGFIFNLVEKYWSNWEYLPQVGMKIKHV